MKIVHSSSSSSPLLLDTLVCFAWDSLLDSKQRAKHGDMSSALYLTTKAGLHFTSQRRPDLQHTTHSKQPAAVLSSKIPNCKLGSDIKHKVAVSIPSDSIIIPLVKFGIRGRICITLTQCWWGRAGLHTRVYVCNGMYPDTHPHTHTHTHTRRARARSRTHARTHAHTDTHTHCAVFFLL